MCEDDEFESALKYALECTGNHGMSPKPEQVTAIRAVYDKNNAFSTVSTRPTRHVVVAHHQAPQTRVAAR